MRMRITFKTECAKCIYFGVIEIDLHILVLGDFLVLFYTLLGIILLFFFVNIFMIDWIN